MPILSQAAAVCVRGALASVDVSPEADPGEISTSILALPSADALKNARAGIIVGCDSDVRAQLNRRKASAPRL